MTKLILFILLGATTSPSVQAGDVKDSRQDVMDFCNQFVIRDPDPGFRLGHHRYCLIWTIGTTTGANLGADAAARHRIPTWLGASRPSLF
jgi:hypothetical protein